MSKIPYIRIGIKYYRVNKVRNIHGGYSEVLCDWNRYHIAIDEGKKALGCIETFFGTVCFPSHLNYNRNIDNMYNTYFELPHKPLKGNCETTLNYLKHLFGEFYEMGLDYLKIIYMYPLQPLPILCLVSKERETGKTTFLKYLREVFSENMTYIDKNSFKNGFNSDWITKLIIGFDEARFHKQDIIEQIKSLSTANKSKVEKKGFDRYETDFFGKFILNSNHESDFINIDPEETRFWVIKVPSISKIDVKLEDKLRHEISAFLFYLKERPFIHERKTRTWFEIESYRTDALQKLIHGGSNTLELELKDLLLEVIDKIEVDYLEFIPSDLVLELNKRNVKANSSEINHILKTKWLLKRRPNSFFYKRFSMRDGLIELKKVKGRYYTIEFDVLSKMFDDSDDLMTINSKSETK